MIEYGTICYSAILPHLLIKLSGHQSGQLHGEELFLRKKCKTYYMKNLHSYVTFLHKICYVHT